MKKAALVVALMVAALAGCGGSTSTSYTGSVHPNGWGSTPKGVTLPAPLPTAVPTATMYDSVTLSTVPAHPFAQAGYTSGLYPTYAPMRAAWPTSHTVSIAINTSHHADCLDVEPGDTNPQSAGSWAKADIAAGFSHPCLYSDLSEMPAVKASLAAAGLSRSQYFLWLAWYRYVPGLVAGYDAVQYTDKCLSRNLDCSTVTLPFLTIAQPPYVAPTPKPQPKPTPKPKPTPRPTPKPGPTRAQVCKTLNARAQWFATQLKQHPKVKTTRRQGALASTRRAERRVGCVVK